MNGALARILQFADRALPPDASVVIVAEDHDAPRDIGRRRLRRLSPTDEQTDEQALLQLERFRSEGAEFLLVLTSSSWWREHSKFRREVEHRYRSAIRDRSCTIHDLGRERSSGHAVKVSVLPWDMGHNPLGRAHTLADLLRGSYEVDVVGPLFDRYGTRIWQPLADSTVPMRTYRGSFFPEYFARMQDVAERVDGDVLLVSKPRLPSFALGILAKMLRNRPLILDCDDLETTFFRGDPPIEPHNVAAHQNRPEFLIPFGAVWTHYCESIIGQADAITVSNQKLLELFGGTLIPHARDERLFDPNLYDRGAIRAEFGIAADERIILFAGTPRAHKGIHEIARALSRIGNPRYRLYVIATSEYSEVKPSIDPFTPWVSELPIQAFARLPALLACADLICILQDPTSEISRYQIPAKVTDAIAMGVPCIVTPVPPLESLIAKGAVLPLSDVPLDEMIDSVLRGDADARASSEKGRKVFLEEFSYSAVRPRISEIISRLLSDPPPVTSDLRALITFQRSTFEGKPPRSIRRSVGQEPIDLSRRTTLRSKSSSRRIKRRQGDYDIVVFWKQNDTGIYGRRQEMLVKYLAESDRVNRILHLDSPVGPRWLLRHLMPKEPTVNQSRLIARKTLRRVLRLSRHPKIHYRTFVHRTHGRLSSRLLPARSEYADWIASQMSSLGIGDRHTVFWVYPRLFGFPDIADALGPDTVVSDLVDDDRMWLAPDSGSLPRFTRNYEEILSRSHLVLASTEAVRKSMRAFAPTIHLLPNACEFPDDKRPTGREPREFRRIRRPIIGYAGNLSSRIDIPLLERIATERPDWSIVLIGSAHLNREVLGLERFGNVHLLGVKPYDLVKRYISSFDVAVIPHTNDAMTRTMNPLKAFVYAALNVPIVSTDIENLGELKPFVQVADGPTDFLLRLDRAVAIGKRPEMEPQLAQVLQRNSWPARVRAILDLLDESVSARQR